MQLEQRRHDISDPLRILIHYVLWVSTILVIYIHVPVDPTRSNLCLWLRNNISLGVCSVAVPTFFAISGFLFAGHILEDGWWKKEITKRIRFLLVPYLLFNALFFPFVFLCVQIGVKWFGANEVFGWDTVSFVTGFGFNPFAWPGHVPSWFLRALFICFVVSPLFVFFIKRGIGIAIVLLVSLFFASLPIDSIQDAGWRSFLNYTVSVCGMFYFALGITLRVYCVNFLNRIAERIRPARMPEIFSRNTMAVYLIHPIILFCIDVVLKPFGFWWICKTAEAFFPLGILLICLSLAVAELARKYFPKQFNLFFGGR